MPGFQRVLRAPLHSISITSGLSPFSPSTSVSSHSSNLYGALYSRAGGSSSHISHLDALHPLHLLHIIMDPLIDNFPLPMSQSALDAFHNLPYAFMSSLICAQHMILLRVFLVLNVASGGQKTPRERSSKL